MNVNAKSLGRSGPTNLSVSGMAKRARVEQPLCRAVKRREHRAQAALMMCDDERCERDSTERTKRAQDMPRVRLAIGDAIAVDETLRASWLHFEEPTVITIGDLHAHIRQRLNISVRAHPVLHLSLDLSLIHI